MQFVIVLAALVAKSLAFVCPPNYCDKVQQPPLNCKGGITKGSGWCGCTDSCARMEGESCKVSQWSMVNEEQCEEGLTCKEINLGFNNWRATCVNASNAETFLSKRLADHPVLRCPVRKLGGEYESGHVYVCLPNACDHVKQVEDVSNCAGSVVRIGYCYCKKTCAKQKGEPCTIGGDLFGIFGMVPYTDKCEDGLVCQHTQGKASAVCV